MTGARQRRLVRRAGVVALVAVALAAVPAANGEQASSKLRRVQSGLLDVGNGHTCVIVGAATRCWGYAGTGSVGYGDIFNVGDNETPGSMGPVALGTGRTARAISAWGHTCAVLDNGAVRCWGPGDSGQLGYGNTDNIGDNETPGSVGPVSLGAGRKAVAIAVGSFHSCALLDNGRVLCWGYNNDGQLGQGNTDNLGDNEVASASGPVELGTTATAIALGEDHTCAIVAGGHVRCWGYAGNGRLGYGNTETIGDNESPNGANVNLGAGRTAIAIAAGAGHTCVILDTGKVKCWGYSFQGALGYGNLDQIGDNETPASVGTVDLGTGRTAVAIAAGLNHTCVILDTGAVRCWGAGGAGRLGYGNTSTIGDNETPASVGPVSIGAGRTAVAISAGDEETCVLLDTGRILCWGDGADGRLGYGNTDDIGDTELPSAVGPVVAGGLVPTKVRPAVSLALKAKRDRTAPYTLTASGKLTGFAADSSSCSGKVVVKATKGKRSAKKTVTAKRAGVACTYSAKLRVKSAGTWKVTAAFAGNGSLKARTSQPRSFRAG